MSFRTIPSIVAAGVFAVGLAFGAAGPHVVAQDTLTPEAAVAARIAVMKSNGATLRSAGGLTGDAAVAAMTTLSNNFAQYPTLFAEGLTTPDSEALPLIWEDWAGFIAIVDGAKAAADAGIAAAQSGDTAAYMQAVQQIGQACGSCHGKYRS